METMLQALVIVGGLTFSLAASLLIEELIFGQIVRTALPAARKFPKQGKGIERSTTMLLLKYLLLSAGIAMFVIAAGILTYDAYLLIAWQRRRVNPDPEAGAPGQEPIVRWRTSVALVMLAWAPLLVSAGIVIVPSGMAGVRVSQTKGTLAGTLYPGVHFVVPLVERVELFNTRDQLFTTGISDDSQAKGAPKSEALNVQALNVQAKEGLTLGLAITVRYQIDPKRLDSIEANLPQPLEKEIVPPVVATSGGNWCRATRFAKSSPLNEKKCASAPPKSFANDWRPTES